MYDYRDAPEKAKHSSLEPRLEVPSRAGPGMPSTSLAPSRGAPAAYQGGMSSTPLVPPRGGLAMSSTSLVLILIVASNAIMVAFLYSDIPSSAISFVSLSASSAPGSRGGKSLLASKRPRRRPRSTPAQLKMLEMRKQNFEGHRGLSGFVQFSAYRLSPTRFVALGLSALALHDIKEAQHCVWEANGGESTPGNIVVKFPGEHHARQYEIVLLFCELSAPTSAKQGGQLLMMIDRLEQVVYMESKGSPDPFPEDVPDEDRAFDHNLTHCSAPMFGALDAARILEWVQFHRVIHGITLFHMYDAGAFDEDLLVLLQPFLDAGVLEITDVQGPAQYDTWSYAQVLTVNDCAFKTRDTSRWILMTDFDEYLFVLEPPHSLSHFLLTAAGAAGDAPLQWVSFGSITFPLETCCKLMQDPLWFPWAVEQLVFRAPVVHCRDPSKYYSRDACLKWDGHRKYVVNPRSAYVLQIHRVYETLPRGPGSKLTDPQDTSAAGLNAHTALMRLHHYRGLGIRGVSLCQQIISFTLRPPKGFVRDVGIARLAVAAHAKVA